MKVGNRNLNYSEQLRIIEGQQIAERNYLIEQKNGNRIAEQYKQEGTNVFYNIMNPSNKIQCDVCKKDVTKCTKVLANDYDYCVGCFSNLDEFPQTYHMINKLQFPIFDAEWTADEELMLFEGLQKHGFGNWGEISDLMGNSKTREEIEDHYQGLFIDSANKEFLPTAPILSKRESTGKLSVKPARENGDKRKNSKAGNRNAANANHQFQRGTLTVHHQASLKTGANPAEIVGFMPKRCDFEVEYDNDAELLLAEMEFNEDDSEEDKKLKFRLIEIYNEKLTQRIKRKEFVISRKLLDLKEQMRLEKTRSKEEKEIHSLMKVFARFNTVEAHEQLVAGIIKEKQIRQQIEELKEYKRKGYKTLAQIQDEIQNKRKREEKPMMKKNVEAGQTRRAKKQMQIEMSEKRIPSLTRDEQQLCNRMNMTFRQYIGIKETIIRESIRQGILTRDETAKIFAIDRQLFDGVFDFLVEKEDILTETS